MNKLFKNFLYLLATTLKFGINNQGTIIFLKCIDAYNNIIVGGIYLTVFRGLMFFE